MATLHTVQHCRWSEQTLYQPAPRWLEAWDYPWCCRTRTGTRVIDDTEKCQTCKRWESREAGKQESGDWGQL
jgi:hypothetical protein